MRLNGGRIVRKAFRLDEANDSDLIVNLSGYDLPRGIKVPVVEWDVPDPIGEPDEIYSAVRDQIEKLVEQLIVDLRGKPVKT